MKFLVERTNLRLEFRIHGISISQEFRPRLQTLYICTFRGLLHHHYTVHCILLFVTLIPVVALSMGRVSCRTLQLDVIIPEHHIYVWTKSVRIIKGCGVSHLPSLMKTRKKKLCCVDLLEFYNSQSKNCWV